MELGPVARPTGASPKLSRAGSDPDPGRPNTRAVWDVPHLVPLRKPRACRRRRVAWNDAGAGLVGRPEQGRSGSPPAPPASRLVRTRTGPPRTRGRSDPHPGPCDPHSAAGPKPDPVRPATHPGRSDVHRGRSDPYSDVGRKPDRAGRPRARGREGRCVPQRRPAAYPGGEGPRTRAGPTRTRTSAGRKPDRAGPPRARGREGRRVPRRSRAGADRWVLVRHRPGGRPRMPGASPLASAGHT